MKALVGWLGLRLLILAILFFFFVMVADILSHPTFHCLINHHRGFCYFW